jgi:hypothetical protein
MGGIRLRFGRPAVRSLRLPRGKSGLTAGLAGAGLLLAVGVAGTVQASTPVTNGYRDFGYGGALATRATSDPEQSKLWYTDGFWWAGLFVSSGTGSGGSHYDIFRLNTSTHSWVDTTRQIDIRDLSHGDYFWDAANLKLYVASSKSICRAVPAPPTPGCNDSIRVYRYSYNGAEPTLATRYKLDAGYPKILVGGLYTGGNFTGGGSNAVTITKDAGGVYWLAYTRDDPTTPAPVSPQHFQSDVYLSHSVDGITWAAPTRFAGAADGELDQDNTASIVAFGSSVGLYWTDKHSAGASSAFFAVHPNGSDPVTGWLSPETVTSGTNAVENQSNLKADSTGKVYAIVKTGLTDQVRLFDRSTGGVWTQHNVWTSGNGNTRAQVVIDEQLGLAYAFSSSGGTTAGTIYVKAAPLSTLSFPTGKGTIFINSATDPSIDDVTLTKQMVTNATGIVAEATDRTTFQFLHGEMTLAASDVTPPAGVGATINGGAAFTGSTGVTLGVAAVDPGSGVSLVRLANTPDVDGSGVLNGASAASFTFAPSIAWTLAAGDGTHTVYAQVRDSAGNWSGLVSDDITLDTTAPVGSVSIKGGVSLTRSLNVTLNVAATDAGVGTVSNVRLANVGGTSGGLLNDPSAVTLPYAATKSWTLAAGADGSRTVYAQWQDSLGNWSGVSSDTITLDTTPPAAGTVSIDETSPTSSATIHLTLTNPGGASAVRVAESPAGLATATVTPFKTSVPYTLAAGLDGTRTVYVQWLDGAGNVSTAATDSIILDLRAPVGKVSINSGAVGTHSLAVTLSFPNTDTDVDQIRISNSPTMSPSTTIGTLGTPWVGGKAWTLGTPLTNGATRAVYVTFHDLAGHVSAPLSGVAYSAADSIRIDLTKPTLTGSVITRWLNVSMIGNAARIRLSWPIAHDTITGVASYRVWVSTDGHAYTFAGAPSSNLFDTRVFAGHTYRYRVYAVDRAVNTSASLYTPVLRTLAYQNTSTAVHFSSGWSTVISPSYYGGSDRWTNHARTSASLTFVGRAVSWVSALGPTRGQARVYVDGHLISTINLYSPSVVARRVVFSRSVSAGHTHTIKVIVVGTAGHPRVDVDAFLVLR